MIVINMTTLCLFSDLVAMVRKYQGGLDVFPMTAHDNIPSLHIRNVIFSRNIGLTQALIEIFANRKNDINSEFGSITFFALCFSTFTHTIRSIFCWCTYKKMVRSYTWRIIAMM